MKKNVLFVGIEVDDKAYHFSIVDEKGNVIKDGIRSDRIVSKLAKEIKKHCKGHEIKAGYEATYVGYTLTRKLKGHKIDCEVLAPNSIPKSGLSRVKNDRIDSKRIALGLARNEVSIVSVPTEKQEADRQLIRSRGFLRKQRSSLKRHILNECRMLEIDYKHETKKKDYWTCHHRDWLDNKIKSLKSTANVLLKTLIVQLESTNCQIDTFEAEIEHLASTEFYKERVDTLNCFKGIQTLTAMTIITEIFDINRFEHPKLLVSFMGLDIGEYSSGGKKTQFGITKVGNRYLRTSLVEANQKFGTSKTPSKRLKLRRKGLDADIIAIADRCQARLYKKGHRLLKREKCNNKVKVAMAREMVGFIWEALKKVA